MRMRFDQSSPVQPVSESRGGGTLSVTEDGGGGGGGGRRTKEILVSNIGLKLDGVGLVDNRPSTTSQTTLSEKFKKF